MRAPRRNQLGEEQIMVRLEKVKTTPEWQQVRAEIESAVLDLLEEIPKERPELQVKTIDEMQFSGYVRRRINYFVDLWERATAWEFVPDGRDELPALLCCHSMTAQGKDEPAGIEGEPIMALAQRYAEKGYVTLAPDCITAGGRVSTGLDPFDTKSFYKENPRGSAMGKMLADHICAIDALCDCKRVDPARIGVVGHGFGATNALMAAAFDERIQACVASCGFTRFADDKDIGRWTRDRGFNYLPKLKRIGRKRLSFDWDHILALSAPSPMLIITALNDTEFSNTRSCGKAVAAVTGLYRLLGAPDAIQNFVHDGGHQLTPEALEVADDWLDRWL